MGCIHQTNFPRNSVRAFAFRIVLRSQYRTSLADGDGVPQVINALCVDYYYPPSPPTAEPFVKAKYRTFLTRKGFPQRVGEIINM